MMRVNTDGREDIWKPFAKEIQDENPNESMWIVLA